MGVIVDIGTGDGQFVYKLAKEHSDHFVIGVDPYQKSLEKVSGKIYKKPQKGGLRNALFVVANVVDLPSEFANMANQVFINFPWGSLLKGIASGDTETLKSLHAICKKGSEVHIILGYSKKCESRTIEERSLPILSCDYINSELAKKFLEAGLEISKCRALNNTNIQNFPTTWAKKIAKNRDRSFYAFAAKCI